MTDTTGDGGRLTGWRSLAWDGCDPPVAESRFRQVEEALGVRFPGDYAECVRQCHGGTPSRRNSHVPAASTPFGSCLAALLSFAEDNPENILRICKWVADQLPPGLVPFAEDGGGDYVCFDYGGVGPGGAPGVVYWHRTGLPENEVTPLASDFSSFVQMLE